MIGLHAGKFNFFLPLSWHRHRESTDWETPEEKLERQSLEAVQEVWQAWRRRQGVRLDEWTFSWQAAPAHGGHYVLAERTALFWSKEGKTCPVNEAAREWQEASLELPEGISESQGKKLLESEGHAGGSGMHSFEVTFTFMPLDWVRRLRSRFDPDVRSGNRLWREVRKRYEQTGAMICTGTALTKYADTKIGDHEETETFAMEWNGEDFDLLAQLFYPSVPPRPLHVQRKDGQVLFEEWDEAPIALPSLPAALSRAAFHGFGASTFVPFMREGKRFRHMLHNWVGTSFRHGGESLLGEVPCILLCDA